MDDKYIQSPPANIPNRIGEKILSGIHLGAIIGYNFQKSGKGSHHWFVKFSQNRVRSFRYKPMSNRIYCS